MKAKLPIIFIIVSTLALVVIILVFGQGGDDAPDVPNPQPDGADLGDQEQYPEFTGTVLINDQELELDNPVLVGKGLVHLPLLELAEAAGVETTREGNVIILGESRTVAREDGEGTRIYLGDTDITPASIIPRGEEVFIEGREVAPLLGFNYYENLFANTVYLMDKTVEAQDGSYVVVRRRDQWGWAPELRMTVSAGEISAVEYVELNDEGVNKFEDPQYLENWSSASEVDPVALINQLESQLLESQSVAEVDVTSGATGSWKNFTQLAANALGKAQVRALPLQYPDGNYVAVGNPSDRGWTPVLEITVAGGGIIQFSYDEMDEEGSSKREDQGYIENWRNAFPEVDPIALVSEREENILKTQDPNLIDATTGATSWGVNIKQYATGTLAHASKAPLPETFDTVYVFFGAETQRGDRSQLLLVSLGEEIVLADFSDYRNGIAKKYDEDYLNAWREQYPDVDPVAIVSEMQETFVQTGNPDDLDVITGATGWRNSFQELSARGLEFIQGD